jgi:hypothetical protein
MLTQRGKDVRDRATVAWRLSSRWWLVGTVLALGLAVTFVSLWVWGDVEVRGRAAEPYLVRDLLKDGADVALKLGAVVAGMLAIYRYWYHRYEPLVYFVSCGLIPRTLLEDLYSRNSQFQRFAQRLGLPGPPRDRLLQRWHDLPIIVVHKFDMDTLGVSEGAKVDLRFDTPDGKAIWAIAFAFSFQSTGVSDYHDWPVGLSLSLRRYFRIERPFQAELHGASGDRANEPPDGWCRVEVNSGGLARLHGTTQQGRALIWMASEEYSVRFRDRRHPDMFFAEDDLEGEGRLLEYVGISLRVFSRSGLRYRPAST